MQGSGWALMQSLARRRGTGAPAGGVSSKEAAAVPELPCKQGLALPWSRAQDRGLVLPAPADSSIPGVSQHTGSCPRKSSCPSAPWSPGSGEGKSQPCVQMSAGWEQGLSFSQCPGGHHTTKWGTFGPGAPEWVGPAPRSGEGAVVGGYCTAEPHWHHRVTSLTEQSHNPGRPTQAVTEESTQPAQPFWHRGAQQPW